MKEEKTSKKKVLTDEELMGITGGTGSNTKTEPKSCADITNSEECISSSFGCIWENKQCNKKSYDTKYGDLLRPKVINR